MLKIFSKNKYFTNPKTKFVLNKKKKLVFMIISEK